jgi:hypothetical protein
MRKVLVSCRAKCKKIIADFQVLGLFLAKNHDLSNINPFRLSRAVAAVADVG